MSVPDYTTPESASAPTAQQHHAPAVTAMLVSLAVLLIAVIAVAAYIWYGMQNTPMSVDQNTESTEVADESPATTPPRTAEEKTEMLSNLERNPSGLTEAQKRARLEMLR